MENDDFEQILIVTYYSGVNEILDSLIESINECLDLAENDGIENPAIGCEQLLESFKKLKELANECQNNGCRMDRNR